MRRGARRRPPRARARRDRGRAARRAAQRSATALRAPPAHRSPRPGRAAWRPPRARRGSAGTARARPRATDGAPVVIDGHHRRSRGGVRPQHGAGADRHPWSGLRHSDLRASRLDESHGSAAGARHGQVAERHAPARVGDDLGGAERAAARSPVQAQPVAGTQRHALQAVDDGRGPVRAHRTRGASLDSGASRCGGRNRAPPARSAAHAAGRSVDRHVTTASPRSPTAAATAVQHGRRCRRDTARGEPKTAAPGSRTAASSRQRPSGRCRNHTTTAAPPRATASAARSARRPRDTTRVRPTRPRASNPTTRTRRRGRAPPCSAITPPPSAATAALTGRCTRRVRSSVRHDPNASPGAATRNATDEASSGPPPKRPARVIDGEIRRNRGGEQESERDAHVPTTRRRHARRGASRSIAARSPRAATLAWTHQVKVMSPWALSHKSDRNARAEIRDVRNRVLSDLPAPLGADKSRRNGRADRGRDLHATAPMESASGHGGGEPRTAGVAFRAKRKCSSMPFGSRHDVLCLCTPCLPRRAETPPVLGDEPPADGERRA